MLNLKRNRQSHWLINKLITANDRIGDTCCPIETITGHQFNLAADNDCMTILCIIVLSDLMIIFSTLKNIFLKVLHRRLAHRSIPVTHDNAD